MHFQIGKNPEFNFSICHNFNWWNGEFALPLKLSWWNYNDAVGNKHRDVAITVLCFRFGLEIWLWNKEWLEREEKS